MWACLITALGRKGSVIHFVCFNWRLTGKTTYYLNKPVQCCIVKPFTTTIVFPHPRGIKPIFLHLWSIGNQPFMDFQVGMWKIRSIYQFLLNYIFGLICWKCDVCSLSCINNCVSKVSPQVCREKAEKQGGLKALEVSFHQKQISLLFCCLCPFLCCKHV